MPLVGLCTLKFTLHAYQVRVIVGDSGLCCCACNCITSFKHHLSRELPLCVDSAQLLWATFCFNFFLYFYRHFQQLHHFSVKLVLRLRREDAELEQQSSGGIHMAKTSGGSGCKEIFHLLCHHHHSSLPYLSWHVRVVVLFLQYFLFISLNTSAGTVVIVLKLVLY